MSDNPLLRALRELLFRDGQCYTEHELIKLMVSRGLLPPDFNRRPVLLFQAHFALFNALYQLQDELAQRDLYLSIGLVEVRVEPIRAGDGRELGRAGEARLREYYLDWSHFEAATDESVASLLDDFWQQLGREPIPEGEREEALAIFALQEPVTYPEVKKRYRRLAMDAHPDRGGDTEQLQSINWAMGVLERAYGAG